MEQVLESHDHGYWLRRWNTGETAWHKNVVDSVLQVRYLYSKLTLVAILVLTSTVHGLRIQIRHVFM